MRLLQNRRGVAPNPQDPTFSGQDSFRAPSIIAYLPLEVLGEIFRAYVAKCLQDMEDDDHDFPRDDGPPAPFSWITISHVCRRWRNATLQAPRLWTTLSPTNPDAVQHVISHSGQLPLTIIHGSKQVHISNDQKAAACASAFDQCFAQFHRARVLAITVPDTTTVILERPHPEPLVSPTLEVLQVKMVSTVNSLPSLSTAILPRLADLSFFAPSDADPFRLLRTLIRPTLTSLTLSFFWSATFLPLMEVLKELPALSRLRLQDIGVVEVEPDVDFSVTSVSTPIVSLNSLSFLRLEVTARNAACRALLRYIAFPQSASLHLVSQRAFGSSMSLVTAATSRIIAAQEKTTVPMFRAKSITIVRDGTPVYAQRMALWGSRQSFLADAGPGEYNPSFSVSYSSFLEPEDKAIDKFFAPVDMSAVETILVRDMSLQISTWINLCGRMTHLEELSICGATHYFSEIHNLCKASAMPLPFPALKVLEFVGTSFRFQDAPCVPHLLDTLYERIHEGYNLAVLKISEPRHLSADERALLQRSRVASRIEIGADHAPDTPDSAHIRASLIDMNDEELYELTEAMARFEEI